MMQNTKLQSDTKWYLHIRSLQNDQNILEVQNFDASVCQFSGFLFRINQLYSCSFIFNSFCSSSAVARGWICHLAVTRNDGTLASLGAGKAYKAWMLRTLLARLLYFSTSGCNDGLQPAIQQGSAKGMGEQCRKSKVFATLPSRSPRSRDNAMVVVLSCNRACYKMQCNQPKSTKYNKMHLGIYVYILSTSVRCLCFTILI